jgi:hypothetical protein
MTVMLTNTSGRCQVFVLAHEAYCRALGECVCDMQPGRGGRRIARSLTLPTGMSSEELPDAMLAVPEIAAAVRRGELSVQRRKPELLTTPTLAPAVESPSRQAKKKRGAG